MVTKHTRQLLNTAHHEAAHAVAAYYLHLRYRHVTIVPKDGSLGHLRHEPMRISAAREIEYGSLRGRDFAERHAMLCFAGPIASRKIHPRSRWRIGGTQDFAMAGDLVLRLAGDDGKCQRLTSDLLWRQAELLVDQRWRDIQAIARALLERHTLSRADVSAVIDRVYGLKPLSIRGPSRLRPDGTSN